MKLPQAILFTILFIFLCLLITGMLKITWLNWLILIGVSVWIFIDSKKIGAEKYKSFWGMSPLNLALYNLLLLFVVLPAYLWTKYRIQHNMLPVREEYKNKEKVNSEKGQKI